MATCKTRRGCDMALPIEKIARDVIRDAGMECEFYAPDPIPASLVTVKQTARTGGGRFVGATMITVQAWADTRGNAFELCSRAVDALIGRGEFEGGGMAGAHDNVTQCLPENGPYRFDDPDVKDRKRWQATVAVDYNA